MYHHRLYTVYEKYEWIVASRISFRDRGCGYVIIPSDRLDGLTNEQIGAAIRELADCAPICNAEESALHILAVNDPPIDKADSLARLRPFAGQSDEIDRAIAYLDGSMPHPRANDRPVVPKKTKPGYIYILKADNGLYKIGLTNSPAPRISSLIKQSPVKAELLHLIPTEDMKPAEDRLHAKYAHLRRIGEWFALTDTDVRWLLKQATA